MSTDDPDLVRLARAALTGPQPVPTGRSGGRLTPLTVDGTAVLARPDPGDPTRLADLVVVGPGRWVSGPDNAVFGRWDGLVGWLPDRRELRRIPGHGGEIIPGRLADHVRALRRSVRSGRPAPVQLDLDVSMACPSACSFCFSADYRSGRRDGRLMTAEAIDRTIRSAAGLGVSLVRFDGGGDPLTSPYLAGALDLCRRLGLLTAVLTAGDLLTAELGPTLVAARTYVRVSLNAGTDATRTLLHRTSSPRTRLSAVLDRIGRLDRLRRDEYGASAPEVMPLGATCMVVPENVGETVAVAAAAKASGIDHVSFRVVLGERHAVRFTAAETAEFVRQRDEVRRSLADDGFQAFFPTRDLTDHGYLPARHFDRCRASTHRALVEVGPDPSTPALVPCGRYRGHGYLHGQEPERTVFGLLPTGTDLRDVWMSAHMTRTVGRFPSACGDCIDRSANLMLAGIAEALADDLDAEFFRYAAGAGVPAP